MSTRRGSRTPRRGGAGAAFLAAAVLLPAALPGCRSGPEKTPVTDDFFFPAPPLPARLQYLRSYSGSTDFEKKKPLLDYLAGSQDPLRYQIQKPFSVAMWKGRLYVTDSYGLQGLNVFDLVHQRFYVLGREERQPQLAKPIHVSVDEEGFKYVSDQGRRQVLVYGPDDAYVRTYGDGKSFRPVACLARGNEVYVLDVEKDEQPPEKPGEEPLEVRRDQVLVLEKSSGKPLRRIGKHGSGQEGFSFASFLALDRQGNLYVSDFMNYRVVKMDPQGNVLLAFGEHGNRPGDFSKMKGIAVDRRGLIYVAETAFEAVQVFDAAGRPLMAFGGTQAPQGAMDMPSGIWIDYDNLEHFRDLISPEFEAEYLVLVCNQLSLAHKITVYAYGKRRGGEYPAKEDVMTLDQAPRKALWRMPVSSPEVKGPGKAGTEKTSHPGASVAEGDRARGSQ